eukprot:GHVU01061954.1.p1 GENE.GHVU01061954.1~~GHVU01061954.1.p1  ORF type:complete len:137 (+),score=23.95 GHVU01061954.1:743-1153(+)
MFWRLVNNKCGRGDKNILAAGAEVPVDIYRIDEVVVDGSQLGLMLIKATYGRPSQNQLQEAIDFFRKESTVPRGTNTPEEQTVMDEIRREIMTLKSLKSKDEADELLRTINDELKAKANEAIACLTGQRAQHQEEA